MRISDWSSDVCSSDLVKSLVDVGYYARDIIDSLKAASAMHVVDPAHALPKFHFPGSAGDLGLSLGDLVNDDLSLYPALNQATASLGVPWLHVAGNHDLDAGAKIGRASWRERVCQYG